MSHPYLAIAGSFSDGAEFIIVVLFIIIAAINKAARGRSAPPTARPTAPTPPSAVSLTPSVRPIQAAARPAAAPAAKAPAKFEFRPTSTSKAPSSMIASPVAQKRKNIEQFRTEEMETAAVGTPLTSLEAAQPAPVGLAALASALPDDSSQADLLRAIILAQSLGPPPAICRRRRSLRF